MHFVPRPEFHPGYCAVTGRSDDPNGFIDTGNTLQVIDPRIFVSVEGVKTLARMIDWTPPEDVEQLEGRIAELESDNEHLQTENEKAREVYASIERLENVGFQIETKAA